MSTYHKEWSNDDLQHGVSAAGWVDDGLNVVAATAPTAAIAGYDYFLLKGPVSRATDTLERLSPNLWWPSDHTWCVAQHFDFPCAYLGGSTETVSDILALAEVESRVVRVNQNITAGYG
ncbi:hypothetical protein [Rhodococcus sp. ANT_H53B]|uniref:hypothetical protein n=1 Tax=Rhodococcus sp. ANT_H53B TaxID=2597357 RepID=UPI0011F08942|nr:hypothetical protein [Rhodococcus sp. ANT_H53B]KAA0922902.1 hypothetical protein FQ188_20060 [Rhodococcus sp. ANT_H53B]